MLQQKVCLTYNNLVMKKILLICTLLTLTVGCTTQKVSHTTFKREYKENRFTKQFQQADSIFNEKYEIR